MGFGLLLLGYLTMLGIMPTSFVYSTYTMAIPIIGGGIMLAAFRKLQAYDLYFKAAKYVCIGYISVLVVLTPFEIIYYQNMPIVYMYVAKIVRSAVLLLFHHYLLFAIHSLAKTIDNPKIKRASKRNLYVTYFYFVFSIVATLPVFGIYTIHLQLFSLILGIVYYFLILVNLFSCYMRITTE